MEVVQHILPLLVSLSLAALVLAVGLNATLDDVLYLFQHPRLLLRAFVAISVVVPAAAILAAALLFVLVGILASLPYQPWVKPRRSLRRRWGVRATGPSPPV